ncbi:hypothetical protein M1C026_0418 [Staphylococcus aureus]|nr:hypothetical protein M1C026_0418 [Staphylococcus aureus]
MTNPNQRLEPFDETFQQPNIHRGKHDYSNHCCYINRNRWIQHVETTHF